MYNEMRGNRIPFAKGTIVHKMDRLLRTFRLHSNYYDFLQLGLSRKVFQGKGGSYRQTYQFTTRQA
jgi:hypothetical protein